MEKEVYKKTKYDMEKAIENLKKEFSTIRTGRASSSMLDDVLVEYYGTSLAINKIANVIVRDARLIEIKPFDKSAAGAIEKAILKSNVGMTPVNDGNIIRLEVPPLTEDRRVELKKVVNKLQEEHKVELRNIRREANEELETLNHDKKISEDMMHIAFERVQKITDDCIKETDKLFEIKSKEIMEI